MAKKSNKIQIGRSQAKVIERRRAVAAFLAIGFMAAGLLSLGLSRAATSVVTAEAEAGTKVGNAVAGLITGASGEASVKFGSAGCALPKYPDASCTGVPAGTSLVAMPAPTLSIQDPNYVIDGKDISGCLIIAAPGVIIKHSRINCPETRTGVSVADVRMSDGTTRVSDLTIEDTEINCGVDSTDGVSGHNITMRRVKIQNCTFAVHSLGNLDIEDSLIQQMRNPASSASKIASGVHAGTSTALNARIQHNTIDATNGGWGIDASSQAQTSQVTITQNYIKGGTWSVLCPTNSSLNPVGNITVTDNRVTTTTAIDETFFNCKDEKVYSGNAYL